MVWLALGLISTAGVLDRIAFADTEREEQGGHTALMLAAEAGDVEGVRDQLRAGANVRLRDPLGRTALMLTATSPPFDLIIGGEEERRAKAAELLVLAGSPINAWDKAGMTALMHAAAQEHPKVAAVLLKHRADVNVRDLRGRTALTWAAWRGMSDPHLVQPLLRAGARVSLVDALLLNDVPRARTLVDTDSGRGVGPDGQTALMLAARAGDLSLLKRLLHRKQEVAATDDRGFSALLFALGGEPYRSQLGLDEWNSFGPREGRTEIVRTLLAGGAPVNVRSKRGDTVLGWAIRLGQDDIARLLLEHGADPNLEAGFGNTPVTHAIRAGKSALVSLMLHHGAQVNHGKDSYSLPLVVAVATRKPDAGIIRMLLHAGARVNERGYVRTPLMAAAREGTLLAVDLLLASGADVNAVSTDGGLTALMLAAGWNTSDIVKRLLAAGAKVEARTSNGETALSLARKREQSENVALLLAAGAADQGDAPPGAVGL